MKIKSKIKDYSLEFVNDIFAKKKEILDPFKNTGLLYFIDANVNRIYKSKIGMFIGRNPFLVISATEDNKSYKKLSNYYRALIKNNFTRNNILVTFGGGTLQDISGFIASTFNRGIKWIFFPTTLLAQADSCIGSKTSINFDNAKNKIGTFYPPDYIFSDVEFCRTLTPKYFNSGLGEIIKFHLMSNERRYGLLKRYLNGPSLRENPYFREVVKSTLEIKYSYFQGDEFDSGRRNLLNYGHCLGHALESASNFAVCHGEAVIVGMGFANLLSLRRGIMTKDTYDEFEGILRKYYPRFDLSKIGVKEIIFYLERDKKRTGKDLTMILSQDIGKQLKCDDVKRREIIRTYKDFVGHYAG